MININNLISPAPVKIADGGKDIFIENHSKPCFSIAKKGEGEVFETACEYLEDKLSGITASELCGEYVINIIIDPTDSRFSGQGKKEGYIIDIKENCADLVGFDEAGAYYAAVSFSRLVREEEGKVLVRKCFVLDYPYFKDRGHFMECRYGSDFMTLEDWKKAIDYLSETKINKMIVGLYGCWPRQYDGEFAEYLYIPFKKHPELSTPRNIKYYSAKEKRWVYKKDVLPVMFTEDYFGEMALYAKKRNIEIVPLFNSLGHNTLIPRVHPEISAKDENGNPQSVGFCTNNDKTYELMFEIYDEIIDRYLKPCGIKSFEIGFDEIWDVQGVDKNNLQEMRSPFCRCEKCKDIAHTEIMVDYLIKVVKYLKSRGMENVYLYHDMLFDNNLINEELCERFKKEGIYDTVVIDWWSYFGTEDFFSKREKDVNGIFRSIGKPITGYFHWIMPTQATKNIYMMKDVAIRNNFEGMIAYGAFEYCYDYNYSVLAELSWNPNSGLTEDDLLKKYAYINFPEDTAGAYNALKIQNDLIIDGYVSKNLFEDIFEYYKSCYLQQNNVYPQDYPAAQFKKISDNEDRFTDYLRKSQSMAESVYKYFSENISSQKGSVWRLSAMQYKALADEFLTIYTCAKAYNANEISEFDFLSELDRLIKQRDCTISLCETVRIPANQYTTVRDMTVVREFMTDLRTYIKNEIGAGRKPEIDLINFKKYLSDTSLFLR